MSDLARIADTTADEVSDSIAQAPHRRFWWCGLAASAAWLAVAALCRYWPDRGEVGSTALLSSGLVVIAVVLLAAVAASARIELPHMAISGVPFMNNATGSPSITCLMLPLKSLMQSLSS